MTTTDIDDAAQPIRDKWEEIKNEFFNRNPGKYLILSCVHRPVEEQFELFKKGRTMDTQGRWVIQHPEQIVTNADGHSVLSAHNYMPSRAIDVAVVDNQTGQTLWEESHYHCLLEIAQGVGLESGGAWHSLKDWPHIQIPNYQKYVGK